MSSIETLLSEEELERLLEASHQAPVLLLKHSLICGFSHQALEELESFLESELGSQLEARILEIQPHRALSNAIAERTGVRHQSPQLLVFRDGEVLWHGSHWQITASRLEKALAEVGVPGH